MTLNFADKTIVFLGPTLPVAEAKKILPDAVYLPPIRCGDIVKLFRLQPKAIIIIDGYFERTAAVWHKEILTALDRGIAVVGASSMGALRAAELASYGMQGVGKIYQDFEMGILEDDDAVAVLHGAEDKGYPCLTDALVNILATIAKATAENQLTVMEADAILQHARTTFYQRRVLTYIAQEVLTPKKFSSFSIWLNNNYINQKQLDAKLALQTPINQSKAVRNTINQTSLLRALLHGANSAPLFFYHDALPYEEKVTQCARLLPEYVLLKQLAKLLSINDRFQQQEVTKVLQNSLDEDTLQMAVAFNKLQPEYLPFEKIAQQQPLRYKLICCLMALWKAINTHLATLGFLSDEQRLFKTVMDFRKEHQLLTTEAMMAWYEERGFTEEELITTMDLLMRFNYLVNNHNVDILNIYQLEPKNWLLIALEISGGYLLAEKLLNDSALQRDRIQQKISESGPSILHSLDFNDQRDWQGFCHWLDRVDRGFA